MTDTNAEREDALEIEVVDDTPEKDRNRPKRPEGSEPYDVKDEELAQYSEGVQSRIKRLRFEFHEERRQKEAADRERLEAVRLAQRAMEDNRRLQEHALRSEKLAMEAAKQRAAADMDTAKRLAREALEAGDTGKAVEHQADMARFAVEADRFANYKPPEIGHNGGPPLADQGRVDAPKVPKPDPRALDWAKQNEWFGNDRKMTGFAFGVHEELVAEGVDPRSDDYYRRLDSEVRRQFPDRFEADEAAPSRKPSTVVAPAGRSVKTPRKVQLTATQVALARKLGLTVEQYAAEIIKANPNG